MAAVIVAVIARRVKALTNDGAVAAAIIGFIVFGQGGMAAALPLLVFFVSGSLLTRWNASRSHDDMQRVRSGVARRDADGRTAIQVLANGGVAAGTMIGAAVWPHPVWLAAFAGAVATAAADTWATELGMRSARPPVLITTGAPATAGQSGAVSMAGTAGGGAGAIMIGVITAAAHAMTSGSMWLAVVIALGGFTGMLADSWLGATVQQYFHCPACGARTEHAVHDCRDGGVRTRRQGGWPGFDNDAVNFTATLIGAVVAGIVYRLVTAVSV